jgi:predicted Zn-dependent protease
MNLIRTCTIFFVGIVHCLLLSAQEPIPFSSDAAQLAAPIKKLDQRHQELLAGLSGSLKTELQAEYKKRYAYLKEIYTAEELVTDSTTNHYLQALSQKIIRSNPELGTISTSIHFARAWWPNAVSYGEGTILFNINLFSRLENEAQAAFIICHELAHYYLGHSNETIRQYVSLLQSESFQKELKTIQQSGYRKNRQLDQLVKTLNYSNRKHSRDKELQADSMAVRFLAKTGYDMRAAISCLGLLDSIDTEKFAGSLQLQKQFHFDNYPFRAKWLRAPGRTLSELKTEQVTEEKTAEQDSLKTHPDCKKRMAALEYEVNRSYQTSQQLFQVNEARFHTLKKRFDAEQIQYCLDKKEIGRALYYSLLLFNQFPENGWLAATIGDCLNQLYQAQQEHRIGKLIELPGSSNNPEYEQLLRLLQQVRLDELASLSYHFMQQHAGRFQEQEKFHRVWQQSIKQYQLIKQ